jgi:aubergine-like protein
MNVEISHKILCTSSVLDKLAAIRGRMRGGNFQDAARKELIGSIIITKYNNKTYRIDDIDFSQNPSDEFKVCTNFIPFFSNQNHLNIGYRKKMDRNSLSPPTSCRGTT